MKKILLTLCLGLAMLSAKADLNSGVVKIIEIRPYIGNSDVYIQVSDTSLCDTSVFKIDTSLGNGKNAYAAALLAFANNFPVRLEAWQATCTGWGTQLQSLYIDRE